MDSSQRKAADIAYACYLWIGLCFGVERLLDMRFGSPDSSEELAALQVVGMLVLLPLVLASLVAALLGTLRSWKLRAWWSKEWGLAVLPALLLGFVVVFALVEWSSAPYRWLSYAEVAYVAVSIVFSMRWFVAARKRV